MPPHILALANTFLKYYSESSSLPFNYEVRKLAEKVLKFFDLDYTATTNTITYKGQEITKKMLDNISSFSIYTTEIDYQDLTDIQELLNRAENRSNALKLGSLFDCIGWVIYSFGEKIKLALIGNECRDSWKDLAWDLDEEATNWKDIIGPDNVDFKKPYKKDWLDGGLQNE